MKKMKFLSGLMILVIIGLFTACEESEVTPPSLTLDGSGNYVAADKSVESGSTIMIKAVATAGDADLTSFKVSRVIDNVPTTVVDSTLDKDSKSQFTWEATLTASLTEGTENFIFTITDKDGETDEKSFVITTTRTPEAIDPYTAIIMGAQSASAGSSLDAETGTVFKLSELNGDTDPDQAENRAAVDIIYYYGISSGNQNTFVAPTHSTVNGVTANDFDYCEDWTTKNATKFKSNIGMTTTEFDAIDDDTEIFAIDEIDDEIITNLQVDNVAAFITDGGKKGVFKVVSITGSQGASVITIDVKIQQ